MEVKVPQETWESIEGFGKVAEGGVVVNWLKEEGDKVKKGEPIVKLEVIKSKITLEAPTKGTLKEVRIQEDEEVRPDDILAIIE